MSASLNQVLWPQLSFGPINLWSFPAEWRRQGLHVGWASHESQTTKKAARPQVHPTIRAVLNHR